MSVPGFCLTVRTKNIRAEDHAVVIIRNPFLSTCGIEYIIAVVDWIIIIIFEYLNGTYLPTRVLTVLVQYTDMTANWYNNYLIAPKKPLFP